MIYLFENIININKNILIFHAAYDTESYIITIR